MTDRERLERTRAVLMQKADEMARDEGPIDWRTERRGVIAFLRCRAYLLEPSVSLASEPEKGEK